LDRQQADEIRVILPADLRGLLQPVRSLQIDNDPTKSS
jgi:hypothetical protein